MIAATLLAALFLGSCSVSGDEARPASDQRAGTEVVQAGVSGPAANGGPEQAAAPSPVDPEIAELAPPEAAPAATPAPAENADTEGQQPGEEQEPAAEEAAEESRKEAEASTDATGPAGEAAPAGQPAEPGRESAPEGEALQPRAAEEPVTTPTEPGDGEQTTPAPQTETAPPAPSHDRPEPAEGSAQPSAEPAGSSAQPTEASAEPAESAAPAAEPAAAETQASEAAEPGSGQEAQPVGLEPARPAAMGPEAPAETTPPGEEGEGPAAGQAAEPGPEWLAEPETPGPGAATGEDVPEPPRDIEATRLRFNFRFAPWDEVLNWFAQQADLSLEMAAPPPGTFNYSDSREYSPAEAIDLINSVLLTKGYVLVRRQRMLMLINLEDGIPDNLVTTIPVEELDSRGEFELVSVLFDLETTPPEEAQAEIQNLIGPQGSVVPLPKSGQLFVTETAGKLRTIRRVIQRIEDPKGIASAKIQTFELKYATADEAFLVLRSLLDIPEDSNSTSDGSLRLAMGTFGTKIYATGKPDMLKRVGEIIQTIDVPGPYDEELGGLEQSPQLEVYPVGTADPDTALAVMQTLLQGLPGVRLAKDPKTGALVVLARPSEHATVRATLEQLQQQAPQTKVIRLNIVDPEVALVAVNKLFGSTGEGALGAPKVDADPLTRKLIVRGTPTQIEQIEELLREMGETDSPAGQLAARGGKVRMIPLTGASARTALERLQEIWPRMRANRIRVVTPSAVIPTFRPGSQGRPPRPEPGQPVEPGEIPPEILQQLLGPAAAGPAEEEPAAEAPVQPQPPANDSTSAPPPPLFRLVSEGPAASPSEAEQPAGNAEAPKAGRQVPASPAAEASPSDQPAPPQEPAEIIVAPGPGGVMIASDDLEALNQFEDLLNALARGIESGGTNLTIFYLKHAKAEVVAQMLDQIFGGGTLVGSPGGRGGSMLGDLANAALGDTAGNVVSSLFGLRGGEGTITPAGAILITPDTRLNALVVQATPTDLDRIQQILQILDQKESPEEILAKPKPRMIPLYNTQAEEIAEIVRQVYQNRLVTSGQGGGGRRGPSPEQIMEFIRRARGGAGGGRSARQEEEEKMSIGVDTRTNSLIVVAPDALFREVKELVEMLDQAALQTSQIVRVVPVEGASAELIEQALSTMLGGSVQVRRTQASSTQRPGTPTRRTGPTRPGGPRTGRRFTPEQIRQFQQRMQFFRSMRGGGGFPGRPAPSGGPQGRGGPGGGGPPGGPRGR